MDRRDVLSLGIGVGALAAAGSMASPAMAQAQGPAAGTSLKRILDRGHLIVGTRSTTIGFGFKDAKGELARTIALKSALQ